MFVKKTDTFKWRDDYALPVGYPATTNQTSLGVTGDLCKS